MSLCKFGGSSYCKRGVLYKVQTGKERQRCDTVITSEVVESRSVDVNGGLPRETKVRSVRCPVEGVS